MKDLKEAAQMVLGRLPGKGNTILPPIPGIIQNVEELEAVRSALSFYVTACEQKKGVTFPLEYRGWCIEIKMGHKFKGSRGSVKGKRGYIATRISDGRVSEFAPSYDTTPSVKAVKGMIDAEERAAELYRR